MAYYQPHEDWMYELLSKTYEATSPGYILQR